MSYTLELGYAKEVVEHPSGYLEMKGFQPALVRPFGGGPFISTTFPNTDYCQRTDTGFDKCDVGTLDDAESIDASIDITSNYSARILAITGLRLAHLRGMNGVEAAPTFMRLVAELGDDADLEDYWNPCDGNIKRLAGTLLDWTFQHPDAVFRSIV